jgi:hypothetical protein
MTDLSGSSIYCPECGQMAIAAAHEIRGTARRQYLMSIDHQWCKTPGCKHELDKGVPWGTGEEVTGFWH